MILKAIQELHESWANDPRWQGIQRPYTPEDVVRLRGSLQIDYTLARRGAERLWQLMHSEPFIRALGAQTGAQAVQQVEAGLKAIYVSGWQVAGDMNTAGQTYPDQSLYPADSVPNLVRRINNALRRADQIAVVSGRNGDGPDWFAPIVADAEAGFGGVLNAFELTKAMIESGAAAVHFQDQNSAYKKCGHMGGKVLVPAQQAVQQLIAARLAAGTDRLTRTARPRSDGCVPLLVIERIFHPGGSSHNSQAVPNGNRSRPFLRSPPSQPPLVERPPAARALLGVVASPISRARPFTSKLWHTPAILPHR